MARINQIHYYPPEVRTAIDAALKAGGQTLDELLEQIRAEHTAALAADGKEPPSRSSLGRYSKEFEETIKDTREVGEHARAWVSSLGHDPGGDIGQMLVQMLQSLSVKSLVAMRNANKLNLSSLVKYAVTAQKLAAADQTQVQRAKILKEEARKELIEEQKKKLEGAKQTGLISEETLQTIRRQIYGLD